MHGDLLEGPFLVVWLLCVLPALVEWLVYVGRPSLLLPLARVPLGVERIFELPQEARVADWASPQQGYRQAAARALTPGALPWPAELRTSSAIGGSAGGAAWVRLSYQMMRKRPLAFARIDATVDLDHVRLTSRWSPFPLVSFVITIPAVVAWTILGGFPPFAIAVMIVVFPVAIAVNWLMARGELRAQVEEAMSQIEARFRDPGAWRR